jgi:protease I
MTEAGDTMGAPLEGMRVPVLVGEGVEDLEYWVTVMRLREAGAAVTSVSTTLEPVSGKNGLAARADRLASDVDPASVDGLVIPGGWMPDKLRRSAAVTDLVAAVHRAQADRHHLPRWPGRDLRRDHRARPTGDGLLGIRDDLVNAGARWVDEPAFRDGTLVWGRVVDDIPAFERELIGLFAEHHGR